jgi:hypothetical protein
VDNICKVICSTRRAHPSLYHRHPKEILQVHIMLIPLQRTDHARKLHTYRAQLCPFLHFHLHLHRSLTPPRVSRPVSFGSFMTFAGTDHRQTRPRPARTRTMQVPPRAEGGARTWRCGLGAWAVPGCCKGAERICAWGGGLEEEEEDEREGFGPGLPRGSQAYPSHRLDGAEDIIWAGWDRLGTPPYPKFSTSLRWTGAVFPLLRFFLRPIRRSRKGACWPADAVNYVTWGIVGFIFQYIIRRRHLTKYNCESFPLHCMVLTILLPQMCFPPLWILVSEDIFEETKADADSTVLATESSEGREAENLAALTKLCLRAHAVNVVFAVVKKAS